MGSGGPSGGWRPAFGASVEGDEVSFRVWAPGARSVELVTAPEGRGRRVPMEAQDGVHSARIPRKEVGPYVYSLDAGEGMPDPASMAQPQGVHGPSMVVDPGSFPWGDAGWRGVPLQDLVIYELHTGTYTREGTFEGILPTLKGLKDELGVTAIELMPVAQFPGSRDWGYDGVFPYAAQNSYGGAEGLARLVNGCHAAGLGVILDVVYNHLGPEGNCLPSYAPYFSERYRTPWGDAMNYDGPGSDFVRRYVVDNALYWVRDLHVDGLRLDAVHAIFDSSPRHILQELAGEVHAAGRALGREVQVIGESDLNDPKVVRGGEECGYGLDAQWSDDLHHAIHTALTGEGFGYYQDYGGARDVARALKEPFVLDGGHSKYRGRNHGAPSTGVPSDRFVVFAQNHDQVGNRADGARLSVLAGPGGAMAAAATVILSPYLPLIFMGEEYGSRAPFHYFCDYSDPVVVRMTRDGRRRELEGQGRAYLDPLSPETFSASRPDQGESTSPEGRETLKFYASLLKFRRQHTAARAPRSNTEVSLAAGGEGIAVRRWDAEEQILLVAMYGGADSLSFQAEGVRWKLALASEAGAPTTLVPGTDARFPGPSASLYLEG